MQNRSAAVATVVKAAAAAAGKDRKCRRFGKLGGEVPNKEKSCQVKHMLSLSYKAGKKESSSKEKLISLIGG